jgi:hypothetical protein
MKKGSYWFSFLSEKEQKEFRENVKNWYDNFHKLMELNFKSFRYFINSSFILGDAPQGHDYWLEISNRNVQ